MKSKPPLPRMLVLGLIAACASLSTARAQSIAPTRDSAAPPAPAGAKGLGFEVENDTFAEAGKIGLWTKADAVTEFDDLEAASLDGE